MFDYHTLTSESNGADQAIKDKQFRVVSVLGVMAALYMITSSGLFSPVKVQNGTFSGGELLYKTNVGDYSLHQGKWRDMSSTLFKLKKHTWDDWFFALYHDDEKKLPSGTMRFSTGILLNDDNKDFVKATLGYDVKALKDEMVKNGYEKLKMPSVEAGVVHFPFNDGVTYALVFQYRVLRKLQKYAREKQGIDEPVILSTCSPIQKMCTYYIPFKSVGKFMLGMKSQASYIAGIEADIATEKAAKAINYTKVLRGLKRLVGLEQKKDAKGEL